jgi:hypothetical protein
MVVPFDFAQGRLLRAGVGDGQDDKGRLPKGAGLFHARDSHEATKGRARYLIPNFVISVPLCENKDCIPHIPRVHWVGFALVEAGSGCD